MRMLSAIDDMLLRGADGAVNFAWTRFSLTKVQIIRFLALALVIGALLQAKAAGQPYAAAMVGGVCLAGWFLWEWRERGMPVRLRNSLALANRKGPLGRVLRGLAVTVALIPPYSPINLVSGACLVALIVGVDALTPEGPPARPRAVGRLVPSPVQARR